MTWHRRPGRPAARVLLTFALLASLAGCTAWAPTGSQVPISGASPSPTKDVLQPAEVTLPPDPVTVINTTDPAAAALATSAALFNAAPAVFVVPSGDERAATLADVGASALGLPVLVGPAAPKAPPEAPPTAEASASPGGSATDGASPSPSSHPSQPTDALFTGLRAELDRLQAVQVVTVGTTDTNGERVQEWASDWAEQLAGSGRKVHQLDSDPQSMDEFVQQWSGDRGTRVNSLTVIAEDTPLLAAALATARAAGAQVHESAADDPLTSGTIMTAVHEEEPTHLLAIGDVFAADTVGGSALPWKLQVAASGQQLPGGGGQWFPEHTLIGLYGTPESDALGILGHQGLPETIKLAESMAAPYRALTETTVVPAFEIIATVAAAQAGGDGNYSNELDVDTIFEWAQAADKAGFAVMIDLQPGRSTFLSQAKEYQKVLMLPNVGLALDPEWRIKPDQVHLEQIGQVSAAEVNEVAGWLADLTRDNALPQKLFVLHQFQLKMLQDRSQIDMSHPELAPLIHADGQGSQPAKQDTWRALHEDAPPEAFWGWKNFTKEDHPMLTPEQTMQVIPTPNLVTYQ